MIELPQPSQWAMLVHGAEFRVTVSLEELAALSEGSEEIMMCRQEVVAKRFWMLEGNWGDRRNLFQWSENVIKYTPRESIDANITMATIHIREWPMIAENPTGIEVLTREDFRAWKMAFEKIMGGEVAEGEAILRRACLIGPQDV